MCARANAEDGDSTGHTHGAEPVEFRLMRQEEVAQVSDLALRVFAECVGPSFDPQGVETFARYADPEELARRSQHDHSVLVATVQESIVGVIELREHQHISLLFVDKPHQRRGIARELLTRALELSCSQGHQVRKVTVNSSPYAVPVYQRLGFCALGPEQSKSGMLFTPMSLTVADEA
jgi:GNAT superfamily N-acetyltransferase